MLLRTISAVLALAIVAPTLRAQEKSTVEERLEKLEREMQDLKSQLKSRDEEIARLKSTNAPSPTAAPSKDAIDRTTDDVLEDIESREASSITLRTPVNFNPDIAIIGDFKGSISTNNDDPAR